MYSAALRTIAWPWWRVVDGPMRAVTFLVAWIGWTGLMFLVPNKSVALALLITPLALLLLSLTGWCLLILEAERERLAQGKTAAQERSNGSQEREHQSV